MKKPLAVDALKAMSPFECAKVELTYPVGFSSFQATASSLYELMSCSVWVRGVPPLSTLAST